MSLVEEAAQIRRVPMLSPLETGVRKMLCFASERVEFQPGEVLFRQGESADAAYVLLEGTVEIVLRTASGSLLVNSMGQYDILGEAGMFGDLPRSATAVASTRIVALRIPGELFRRAIHDSPAAALQLSQTLAQRLAKTTAQLCAAVG
jgi:CRP/FNR family transcriptional regulator, cyclic AMP receptor protein